MKLINVLMAAWVATTAASNEDDPSSLDNEDGSRQGVVTEVYIDSNGEATFADENFEVCGEDQETCHYWGDDGLWNYYCAALVDGGCQCPIGQKKCDAFPLTGVASFCAIVCCDSTEEACWDYADDGISLTQYCASLADGGCSCPEGQEKCDGDPLNGIASYCATICCDPYTEETCYDDDEDGKVNQYCTAFAEGGCPCPQGQEMCNADQLNGFASYCAVVCCDSIKEEICVDLDEDGYVNQYCAAIAEGGCPCHEGQKKCNDPFNDGSSYCALVCCNGNEETCSYYDNEGNLQQYCASLADGGCRETDSDENINYLISDLGNATYDEQEVARVLHAM
ncbi:hypothetical protein ACHAXH_007228 [Discostella pseudostelligera]